MIIQKFKNGESEIRIENAENMTDAKENGFPEGMFSRYFIDDKPVDSYFTMINHIIDSTKKGGAFKMPSDLELKELQKQLIQKQKQNMLEQVELVKKKYAGLNIPKEVLEDFDRIIDSIDIYGVRVKQ